MKCLKCHIELSADAKFCYSCGEATRLINNCPKCNAEIVSTANFCHKCGETLSTKAVVPIVKQEEYYFLNCPNCSRHWNYSIKQLDSLGNFNCSCGKTIKPKFYGVCPTCCGRVVFRNTSDTENVLGFGVNFLTGFIGGRYGYNLMDDVTAPPTAWGYCPKCGNVSIFCDRCNTITYDSGGCSELSETRCTGCGRFYSKCGY